MRFVNNALRTDVPYGGREGSPAPAFKSLVAKCKSSAVNVKAARQMQKPRGKCKNMRGCLNLVHAVSHYHVGMESRFVIH